MRESESTAGQYSLSVRHEGKKYHYRIQVFSLLYLITCIVFVQLYVLVVVVMMLLIFCTTNSNVCPEFSCSCNHS